MLASKQLWVNKRCRRLSFVGRGLAVGGKTFLENLQYKVI